ncbi:hypothetical protein XPA_006544 [Xanthoria parietina]
MQYRDDIAALPPCGQMHHVQPKSTRRSGFWDCYPSGVSENSVEGATFVVEAPFFGGFVADLASRKVMGSLACEHAAKHACDKSRWTNESTDKSHKGRGN